MKEDEIILERINRNDPDDIASGKIYDNDARLRASIVSAHNKADDNTKAIEDQGKEIDETKTERKEYVNVSHLNKKYDYASKAAARNAVPIKIRALGQTITYQLKPINEGDKAIWKTEQFAGTSLEDWSKPEYWSDRNSSRIFDGGRSDTISWARTINCGGSGSDFDGELVDCGGSQE